MTKLACRPMPLRRRGERAAVQHDDLHCQLSRPLPCIKGYPPRVIHIIVTASAEGDYPVSLRIGDWLVDLTFVQPDGSAITLATFAGKPLLLIFLRHLA
jgi:hypothetical protein